MQLRLYRRFLVFSRRRPFWFFVIIATPVVLLYFSLELFSWGVEVNNFISLMFSVEIGATRLIEKEKSFWIIVGLMYASHAANILIDLFVVRTLLLSRRIRQLVHILSVLGKEFLSFLKMYLKICMQLFKKVFVQKGKDTEPHNEVVPLARRKRNIIVRFWNHLDDVRKDPTKAGLWTVYALCVPPRMPVGGVSLAVFLVQYNKMGLRGWLAIFVGVTTHVAWALPSAYGVLSFF